MKNQLLIAFFVLTHSILSFGQKYTFKPNNRKIEKACNTSAIYAGPAIRPELAIPVKEIEKRLNDSITDVKKNPEFRAEPSINLIVTCKGELSTLYMDVGSGDNRLDIQLLDFFRTIDNFKPGEINGQAVDSWYQWNFKIRKGYITIRNIAFIWRDGIMSVNSLE